MKKRILSLLLLGLILTSAFSCGKQGNETSDDTAKNGAGSETSAQAETQAEAEQFLLPDELDYGGRDFVILACDESVPHTYIEDFEQDGDIMNDSIYTRNRLVEEYLNINIKIKNIDGIDMGVPVSKDVMSGGNEYDMVSPHILHSISKLVTEHYVVDLAGLKYTDFTKSWWNQGFTDTLSIKDKLYFASGDMIVPNARVIVFNKQMLADNNLPDVYEAVNSGTWTIDKLGDYTKNIIVDLDGNGVFDQNDQYAFSDLSNTGLATSFVHGSGELFVEKSDDGFKLTLDSEKMNTIITKLYDYLYRDGNTEISNVEFGNGKVLFGSQVLLKLQILRDYDTDFGILPFPKFDEAQDRYYSSVWNGLICIPTSADDPECSGAVAEAMAYYSQSNLIPAYYDDLLSGKFARDQSSHDMLNIVFDGLVYDCGLCFDNFLGNYASIGSLLNNKSTDLASFYAKNAEKYNNHYKEIYDAVN